MDISTAKRKKPMGCSSISRLVTNAQKQGGDWSDGSPGAYQRLTQRTMSIPRWARNPLSRALFGLMTPPFKTPISECARKQSEDSQTPDVSEKTGVPENQTTKENKRGPKASRRQYKTRLAHPAPTPERKKSFKEGDPSLVKRRFAPGKNYPLPHTPQKLCP